MLNRHLLMAYAGVALVTLAACNAPSSSQPLPAQGVVNIPGMGQKACVNDTDVNVVASQSYELKGAIRAKLLTVPAQAAGIRVMSASSETAGYGTQVLYYYAPDGNCLLWSESLTLQEFSTRLGLDPLGISPFYQPDQPAKIEEKK